jgi:phosphonate ABC transporter permease subunit PhnE
MDNKKPSLLKSVGIGLIVIIIIIVYGYGFQVTDVDFATTREENRLTQLKRVLRALVKPDILEYETVDTDIEVPFYLPCPEGQEIDLPEPDTDAPYLLPSVPCAAAKEIITIEGFNMQPNNRGPLFFITASGVKKQLGNFQTDSKGYFQLEIEIPNRQPVAEAQHLLATTRVEVGSPMFTRTAKATWVKIIETVFIALLATTIGTIISIPVSFLAARNLMSKSKSPLTSAAFSIIGWPLGMGLSFFLAGWIGNMLSPFTGGFIQPLIGILLGGTLAVLFARSSMGVAGSNQPGIPARILRTIGFLASFLISIAVFIFLGTLSRTLGSALIEPLGVFGFLGNLLFQLGDTATMLTPVLAASIGGAVIGSVFGKFGQSLSNKLAVGMVKGINILVTALAGAVLFALIGAAIDWFYLINNLASTLYWPAGVGAVLGLLLALWIPAKQAMPTGMVIYFTIRTILNATRSIEPLIMAIVFVIWVGIGPFAGSLALALHTIASLAKLYSEQVESILPGPLEAVQATGANHLQTIIYAVIPQIVPPYISFTMYRWDINVRMSTIIGFVGGGGIGFLLIQNINLLNYRAASVQMLAIAIVVSMMDYISSQIREKLV